MVYTKILRHIIHNGKRTFMSTSIGYNKSIEDANKKLDHYRHLNALDNSDVNPSGWDEAKPFESIPGPKPVSIIGNLLQFALSRTENKSGMQYFDFLKLLHKEYGDVVLLKSMPGKKPMVFLFNVKDFEMLYRNEGVWPIRKENESVEYYRKLRKDIFTRNGLLTCHGEEWFKLRSMVNPILMQPRNVIQYVDRMNLVADELVDNIKYYSEQNPNGEMPEDFTNELYKWALESIGVVTMDRHLGCLKRNVTKDSEPQKLIKNALAMPELIYKLDVLPSMWKIISTPTWRELVKVLNFLSETNIKYINRYLKTLDQNPNDNDNINDTNVLQKMVKIDRDVAVVMAIDMLIGGVDTTGRIIGAALYYLSKYPEAQQQLRNEAFTLLKTKDAPITKEILSKASYLKAAIKETLRLAPIGGGSVRTTVKKLVLGGYQIPKGTDMLTNQLYHCHMDKNFPRAKDFLPERWLSTTTGELSHKNINPFIYTPFGFGPRACVGQRLANLELEVALLKIIRNFEMSWPHEDMVFEVNLLYGLARPLKIHIKSLKH